MAEVLCVSCAQLPRKDKSLASKTQKCPECKCTFGVTSYGTPFRFMPPSRNRLIAAGTVIAITTGAGIFTLVLILVGMGIWSTEVTMPNPRPVASKPADDYARIREVAIEDPISHSNPVAAKQTISGLIQKIRAENNNGANKDAFVLAQMERRRELRGLPFVMGDACRLDPNKANSFENSVEAVRDGMERDQHRQASNHDDTTGFWNSYQARVGGQGVQTTHGVAALSQILGPERVGLRHSLVVQLAQSKTPEATRVIARAAIFDPEGAVRQAAIKELKNRPKEHNVDDILMHGIRHPMPVVSHRASYAIRQLDRKDLAPQLAAFLDEPAPGDPEKKMVGENEVCEVREAVRINHHRNCLLCHPPSATGQPNEVPGVIPIPGTPFSSSPKEAYGRAQSSGEPMVRADTTYLRQDFSMMMPVANHGAWPEMQRFDFIVRNRVVEGAELKALQAKMKERPADFVAEQQRAAIDALRRLTGRDAGANGAAWMNAIRVNRGDE